MIQLIGGVVVLLALLGAGVWAWLTFGKGTVAGQTTVGQFVTSILESAQLTTTLGYVELLSKVDAIEASPEATKACGVIADCLWAAAKEAWSKGQSNQPGAVLAKTLSVEERLAALEAKGVTGTIPAATRS